MVDDDNMTRCSAMKYHNTIACNTIQYHAILAGDIPESLDGWVTQREDGRSRLASFGNKVGGRVAV